VKGNYIMQSQYDARQLITRSIIGDYIANGVTHQHIIDSGYCLDAPDRFPSGSVFFGKYSNGPVMLTVSRQR
jgi:hypothetical protein